MQLNIIKSSFTTKFFLVIFFISIISWSLQGSSAAAARKEIGVQRKILKIEAYSSSNFSEGFRTIWENLKKYLSNSKQTAHDDPWGQPPINIIQSDKIGGKNDYNLIINLIQNDGHSQSIPGTLFWSWEEANKLFPIPDDPTVRSALPNKRFLAHFNLNLILQVTGNLEKTSKYCEKIVLFGLPQRDRFIFLGDHDPLLQLMNQAVFHDLKFKFGLTHQGTIIKDPEIYSGGMEWVNFENESMPRMSSKELFLRGKAMRVTAAPFPTYITFTRDRKISGGTYYLMLKYFGDKYNYSMDIDQHSAKGTGIFRQGFWNGVTGAVYYKLADVGIPMGGTVERYGVIDFVTFQSDFVLFFTRPPNAQIKWQAIVYPYTPTAWFCIFVSYLAVSLTLFLQLWRAKEPKKWYHSVFIPYQITLDQGFDLPIPDSVKFLSALFMFVIVIISTGYRSDLVSYFSFPEPEKIPRDFETLDRRLDYHVKFNYHAGTAFHYFDSAKFGTLQRIRQRFDCEPNTAACAISAALDPRTVCITWGEIAGPIISGNLTLPGAFKPMIVFSKPAATFPVGFAFPKNSILTDTFEMLTRHIRDMGLVQQLNRMVLQNFTIDGKAWMRTQREEKLFKSINNRWKKSQELVHSFELKNLRAIFVILLLGLAVSVLFCGIEGAIRFAQKRSRNKNQTSSASIIRQTATGQSAHLSHMIPT